MKLTKEDLDYRPDSYWESSNPLDVILARISGKNRRQMIIDYWDAGILEELDDVLLQDELTTEVRKSLGRIHPSFMGGEYLPPKGPDTVAIAVIDLDSTTSDVIEIRATRLKRGWIRLEWVDEYQDEGDSEFTQPYRQTRQPLTVGRLIRFIERSTWSGMELPLCYNQMNYEGGSDAPELRHFTSMSSSFYPKLGCWFEGLAANWVKEKLRNEQKTARTP